MTVSQIDDILECLKKYKDLISSTSRVDFCIDVLEEERYRILSEADDEDDE